MTTLKNISKVPETQGDIDSYHHQIKNEIINGDADPLEILKHIKAFEKLLKGLLQDPELKDHFLDEAEKHGSKTFDAHGAKFQVKEAGTKYDYSACGDSTWKELSQKEKEIADKRKEREKTLKAHKEEWADPETGEVINPPVKKSTTTVTVEIK